METNDIDHLIQRYLENTITEKDRLELMRLTRAGKIEELLKGKITETLSEEMRGNLVPDARERHRSEKIFQSIVERERPVNSNGFAKIFQYAAAVIVLGIAGLSLYFQDIKDVPQAQTLATTSHEQIAVKNNELKSKKIVLQDGSTVLLEPGSEVRYDQDFRNKREVFLSGEAFFEVTKDAAHPFVVYTDEVTTKVLGTSFRIIANKSGKEVVVAVKTGKVSVFTKSNADKFQSTNSREITLTPNQQAIYKRNEHVVVKKVVEKPEVILEHKSLKSTYINEQVVVILKALSESYGVEMRYDSTALSGCTLTSDVLESEGLFDQLDILCSALGGTYKLENDASIVINANGCHK
jgi:transmembrane sensor